MIYPFSSKCESHWYDKWSVQELNTDTRNCLPGGLLIDCKVGACKFTTAEEEQNEEDYHQFQSLLMATKNGIQVPNPMLVETKAKTEE